VGRRGGNAERAWGSSGSAVAKLFAGAGLLAIGVCFGVVLGSVLDGPRLFVRRLTQASQRVELRPSGAGRAPAGCGRAASARA
jgi:hypothetical protein